MYGIFYRPDSEFVSFEDNGKNVLFTENEAVAVAALNDILYFDDGYDGEPEDFGIQYFNINNDGSEYVTELTEFVPLEKLDFLL